MSVYKKFWTYLSPCSWFLQLLCWCHNQTGDREKELQGLLQQCLLRVGEDPYQSIELQHIPRRSPDKELQGVKVELQSAFADLKEAYTCLCQLLVELSSFPASFATLKTILLADDSSSGELPLIGCSAESRE